MSPDLRPSKAWPPFLQFLHEKNIRVRKTQTTLGFEVFYVDLSSFKLRLTEITPLIWVKKSDIEKYQPYQLYESLQDVLRERGMTHQTALVVWDGDAAPLAEFTTSPMISFVLLGLQDQARIQQSRRPTWELMDLIAQQVPISTLSPYETSLPVTGSRFFGRDLEKRTILMNSDRNYIVLGVRRIGKTSLLREIERALKEKEGGEAPYIHYMDCSGLLSTEDYVYEVVQRLNPRELQRLEMQKISNYFPNFLARMCQKHKHKLIFLMDEIDDLLIAQRSSNWDLIRMLRVASNEDACRFILAGFRVAMMEQSNQDSPFYNFTKEVRLSGFNREDAHQLIVTPMEHLRVRFKNQDDVVATIYDETAGHPNLMQYYCSVLLKQLDVSGEREISPASLFYVYGDEGFRSQLLNSFIHNTQNREKALVYAYLKDAGDRWEAGFSQEEMDTALEKEGIQLFQDEINEACEVLKLAGVLQQKDITFSFTAPILVKFLLRSFNLEYLLKKIKQEGI